MAEWESVLPKLKLAYAAWSESKGKSIETWLALCGEEIDFRSLASGGHNVPWTCNWTTRQGVRAYLEGLTAQFQMEHFTVERFVCQDDTIVVISETAWKNPRTGRRIDTPKVDVWKFKDGKAVGFQEFYDTANVAQAAAAA